MSADDPTTAALIDGVFDRCDNCGELLNPRTGHDGHECNTDHSGGTTAAERQALRDAEDRDPTTIVVVSARAGGQRAYHARRAPGGSPEPACEAARGRDVRAWRAIALGTVGRSGYPCRHCWPRFSEVADS